MTPDEVVAALESGHDPLPNVEDEAPCPGCGARWIPPVVGQRPDPVGANVGWHLTHGPRCPVEIGTSRWIDKIRVARGESPVHWPSLGFRDPYA